MSVLLGMFVFVADFRFPTFQTSLLHCITLPKRVYSRVMNMEKGICPASVIIFKWLLFKSPVFPSADLSETLHASLNMFSEAEPYVPFALL